MDDLELYGEVREAFLPDDNNFNIQIISFGYFSKGDMAMPRPGQSSKTFSVTEAKKAESLIIQLVAYTSKLGESEDRAFVESITETSHFMVEVLFSEGWILILQNEAITSIRPQRSLQLQQKRQGRWVSSSLRTHPRSASLKEDHSPCWKLRNFAS